MRRRAASSPRLGCFHTPVPRRVGQLAPFLGFPSLATSSCIPFLALPRTSHRVVRLCHASSAIAPQRAATLRLVRTTSARRRPIDGWVFGGTFPHQPMALKGKKGGGRSLSVLPRKGTRKKERRERGGILIKRKHETERLIERNERYPVGREDIDTLGKKSSRSLGTEDEVDLAWR